MVVEGLRERSKARRREAILRAAYELFADHGFEATTITDIAEAAEVSRRTVTLYFPSKLDLAMAHFDACTARLATALREREPGRSTVDALEDWLRDEFARRDALDDLMDRMFDLNPQLKSACLARMADVLEEGARILAEEKGGTLGDFGPRMAAAAAAAVIYELGPRPTEADVDVAMAFLRAGVAALPSATGTGTETG
ncbi:TetR family transcriptional regulator [Streptomyces sp. NPDC003077]|uniref:TetR/AcrR family transcriptional regulator n=1 Tax=Streptomyces sp. NPDC003077 TaxID=3154443 RepID=UPI0033B91820